MKIPNLSRYTWGVGYLAQVPSASAVAPEVAKNSLGLDKYKL